MRGVFYEKAKALIVEHEIVTVDKHSDRCVFHLGNGARLTFAPYDLLWDWYYEEAPDE